MNFLMHYPSPLKKDILSIFSLDLHKFPDPELKAQSDKSRHDEYVKELLYPECGIFDFVKARVHEGGRIKNFLFTNLYTGLDIPRIEILVNRISDIYGEDLLGRGAFEHEDKRQLFRGAWVGRVYSDLNRYRSPLIISLVNNHLQLMLTLNKESSDTLIN